MRTQRVECLKAERLICHPRYSHVKCYEKAKYVISYVGLIISASAYNKSRHRLRYFRASLTTIFFFVFMSFLRHSRPLWCLRGVRLWRQQCFSAVWSVLNFKCHFLRRQSNCEMKFHARSAAARIFVCARNPSLATPTQKSTQRTPQDRRTGRLQFRPLHFHETANFEGWKKMMVKYDIVMLSLVSSGGEVRVDGGRNAQRCRLVVSHWRQWNSAQAQRTVWSRNATWSQLCTLIRFTGKLLAITSQDQSAFVASR